MAKLFTEDIVALKANNRIIAVVEHVWTDIDPMQEMPDDWITHTDVPSSVLNECIETGKAPENHVVVHFIAPFSGSALVHTEALVVLDRGLCVGDVVKRNASDSQSGTVTNTQLECRLQPIYTDLPYQGQESWPHKPEDNEFWVPAEELRYWDFQERDYVYFQGWIGQVLDIVEEVTVRLQDGNVVRVENPDDLYCSFWRSDFRRVNRRHLEGDTLVNNLWRIRNMLEETNELDAMAPPPLFFPGLRVQTKKANLRRGQWVVGQYNASTSNKGIVVETRVTELMVDWVTTNIYDPAAASNEAPDSIITIDSLDQVKRCNTQIPGSPYGSRLMHEMLSGDLCKFRDEAGAAVKYPVDKGQPGFRRIDRRTTQGYNMNVFRVMDSNTKIDVEWQDGSRSTLDSKEVVPYVNIDEKDIWPGEAVSIKEQEVSSEGIVKAHKVGIVQSVDAIDRIANVRWFIAPDVSCYAHDRTTIVPGGNCGELSTEVSAVSVYEVVEFEAMTKRRGDIVILSPETSSLQPLPHPLAALGTNAASWLRNLITATPDFVRGPVLQTETSEGLPWVGEVVDLNTDGWLVVRLGAMQPPRDVRVRADKVLKLVGADEEMLNPTEDDDESMEYESDEMSVDTIAEEVEYEGGERLDNGDEEAWQTDSSDDEQHEPKVLNPDGDTDMTGTTPQPAQADPAEPSSNSLPAPRPSVSPVEQTEYQFNEYSSMPPQFMVLDEDAPADHHFVSHANASPAAINLKRIRKEHKLLQSSLPRGIWVRTWSNRLDLIRILIIGPRGTPYALAPFAFDFVLGANYPKDPPEAHFHSWTKSMGRINPNLYEDGKVCLSILGTWPGSEKTESWSSEHSSMLQVIVSLLGLVLVERPYYNEAGFESLMGTEDNIVNEKVYSEKALVMAKGFVVHALQNHLSGLDDVLLWVYKSAEGPQLLRWVVEEAQKLRDRGEDSSEGKLSRGIMIILERHLPELEGLLGRESSQ